MASVPPWTTETPEKVNYTKLCRLLYDGGSHAVRSVFDGRCPLVSLAVVLNTNRPKLLKLKKPAGRVLSNDQWDKLYPPSGASPNSKDFDITLLFVLLRNICGLTKPATGWDALPPPADTSLEANLVRIKYYRNNVIAHSSDSEVDDKQFETNWKEISTALLSLGLKQDDIDELKSSPLGFEDYNQLLEEWYHADDEIKTQLKKISEDTSESMLEIKRVKLHLSDTKAITKNIEADVAEIKQTLNLHQEIDKLAHRDFSNQISKLCQSYHPNTREWIMEQVKLFVEKLKRYNAIVIKAGPGMGKSVVAAKICQFYKEQGVLGSCHFFQHDNSLHNNPRLMLQSVAKQLCDSLPDYRAAVEKQLKADFCKDISNLSCRELFTLLFEEPCSKLTLERNFVVVVVDALDECCNGLKREFFQVLEKCEMSTLPSWLRFVFTTRPSSSFSSVNVNFGKVLTIRPDDDKNRHDLQTYFTDKLKDLGHLADHHAGQINHLVNVTEGLFLVAFFVIDFLKNSNCGSLSEAVEHFPKGKGITSVYENYFSRLQEAIMPHIKSEEGFFKMLDAVVEAKLPIEKNIFYNILGLADEPRVRNRERKEAINLLHQLFPVENDHVSAFHKTVNDWLTTGDHDFSVKGDGSGVLANACYEILNHINQGLKNPEEPHTVTESESYALRLGAYYMENPNFSKEKRNSTQCSCLVFCFRFMQYCFRYNGYSVLYSYDYHEFPPVERNIQFIYENIGKYTNITRYHRSSCRFCCPITLSCILETILQSLHLNNICSDHGIQLNPKPIDLLKEYGFPYQERQVVLKLRDGELPIIEILPCHKAFFLLQYSGDEITQNSKTLVQKFQLDGSFVIEKPFSGHKAMDMSPDNRFIVAIPVLTNGDIEIIDADTLTLHTSCKPPSVVRSCHVYGCKPWYIVARCYNNKIYIMEGETGNVIHQPVDIDQYEEVEAVSSQGHIVIGKTSLVPMQNNMQKIFVDEEGTFFEEMIWSTGNELTHCRKLFLCHFNESHEFIKVPIYPRRKKVYCYCTPEYTDPFSVLNNREHFQYKVIHFSDDGHLLAFVYKNFITVIDTANGSVHSEVLHHTSHGDHIHGILFLSKDFIVLHGSERVYSINLKRKEVEHEFSVYYRGYGRPALQMYTVPGFIGREKVFLTVNEDLDKWKSKYLRLTRSITDLQYPNQNEDKDVHGTYIYKHSIYDLSL